MNKRIYLIVAAGLMLLAGCGTKKNTDKDMNVLSFNEKQAAAQLKRAFCGAAAAVAQEETK